MGGYKQQAKQLKKLGISHRAAAHDLGIPASSFGRYLRNGLWPARLSSSDFSERVDRYTNIKGKEAARGSQISSSPLSGKFTQLGMSLEKISALTCIERNVLARGIYKGLWPDELIRNSVTAWIDRELNSKGGKKMLTKIILSDEVCKYWGLARDPFSNEMETAEDIIDTRELSRAEKKIMLAVDKSGWVAVTGPIGCGKSTLLKKIEGRLERRKDILIVKPRIIQKEYLGASHVCDSILQDLGTHVVLSHGTLEHKARLVGRTLEETHRDGKKVIILIDEAHLLRPEALLALKRMYEFEIGFKKLLSIILVGQVRLARQLKTNFELTEVSQRVDLYEIGSLNGAIGSYLKHKLERAGSNGKEIFEPSSVKAMQERVDTPLSINNLAAGALTSAWDLGEKHVTGEIIKGIQGAF